MRQISEAKDRVEDALAAHLDYLEMGGPQPDTSHLTDSEQEQLRQLIATLELTEGVEFGLGRRDDTGVEEPVMAPTEPSARPEQSALILSQLRDALPSEARLESDPTILVTHLGGFEVLDRWIIGTFGGRVRVWLLAVDTAQEIESTRACLSDLNRIFRTLSDTTAVAVVALDLSCLIVRPEDCAPQIQLPGGSLSSRRYRGAIEPVAEAVAGFLDELIPYWDPVPAFDRSTGLSIDVSDVGEEFVRTAVEKQRGIGQRARKGNPKKDALLSLGTNEIAAIARLADGLFDGSVDPTEVGERIERLAKGR